MILHISYYRKIFYPITPMWNSTMYRTVIITKSNVTLSYETAVLPLWVNLGTGFSQTEVDFYSARVMIFIKVVVPRELTYIAKGVLHQPAYTVAIFPTNSQPRRDSVWDYTTAIEVICIYISAQSPLVKVVRMLATRFFCSPKFFINSCTLLDTDLVLSSRI